MSEVTWCPSYCVDEPRKIPNLARIACDGTPVLHDTHELLLEQCVTLVDPSGLHHGVTVGAAAVGHACDDAR